MIRWLQYSGIWVTLVCNPFHWRIGYYNNLDNEFPGPNRFSGTLQLAFLTVRLVIDNGDW